ncbi:MAG: hypothetical protein OXC15_01720 [Rhodospirillaceae bacterium]|nr:hypothetical protein [Rhodospirillaceae bacterium]
MTCTAIPSAEFSISAGLLGAAAALLGAALGAFLTHRFNRNRDHLELKRDVLRRLMGYRWQLTQGHQQSEGFFFTALNEIPLVFAGDKIVEDEINRFRMVLASGFQPQHLRPLLEAAAKSAKVPYKRWSDEILESPFTPPSL